MLKLYDYLDEVLATRHIRQMRQQVKLEYYASELMEKMDISNADDMSDTLFRTMKICAALDIPISDHFKKIYRYDGEQMITDWQMSALACYLMMLNGNPMNSAVAKAQFYVAIHAKK